MLKCGGKIRYIHIVVVIVVDRIFGQFTMETILATAFGRQVNVLKGEGDELTEAAAGLFSKFSFFSIWMGTLYCMYNNYGIMYMPYLYNALAQLPVLYTVTGLMIPYLRFTADMQKLYNGSSQLIQVRRQAMEYSEVTLVL